ncbi:HopJ type III effector protein [Methylomonas sp. SURF-1]|uniref:HopJ type III effector protein n=1 Tax=Methylomonas aurea TaxID=2952224 RepID=A0ABT1UE65_9GAMM|nr:HopJ type III effector protein [Methylomonas sp. SURF-1]MCQ8180019.1 HopJ type III effector protein [Methylomonas sp. SURF-1]
MNKPILLNYFLEKLKNNQTIDFKEAISVIAEHYDYRPTRFRNGLEPCLINEAGQNEGSCRIFAFARIHNLSAEQTLALFGDYYRKDVLGNPDGSDHQNIRNFIRDGWAGIQFDGEALQAK